MPQRVVLKTFFIVNKTDSKLNLPNGSGRTYCRKFLDDDYHCNYDKNCGFKYEFFPKDFSDSEVSTINKWVKDTDSLPFKKKNNYKI